MFCTYERLVEVVTIEPVGGSAVTGRLADIFVADPGAASIYRTEKAVAAVGKRGVFVFSVTDKIYPTPVVPGMPEMDQPGWSHPLDMEADVYGMD
jgi:hypothetical protein